MMKLYYRPGTCSIADWIALEWAGADYETELAEPSSESFQAISPLGQVPVLDIGEGRPLTQNVAILGYIADRFPEARLGADGSPEQAAHLAAIMSFLSGDLHPAYWPYFAPKRYMVNPDKQDLIAIRDAAIARVATMLGILDTMIGDSNHLFDNRRSIADAFAYVLVGWSRGFDRGWKSFPNIARFMEAMSEDAAVQKVLAEQHSKADA